MVFVVIKNIINNNIVSWVHIQFANDYIIVNHLLLWNLYKTSRLLLLHME